MIQLILSICALFIGVGLWSVIRRRPSWLTFFDSFVLVSIVGLTAFHLIPHSIENSGIWGVVAVIVGFGVPALMHRMQGHAHGHGDHDAHDAHHTDAETSEDRGLTIQKVLLAVAFIGVCIHTLLDGIGLSMSSVEGNGAGSMLGLSVLLHRLPVGLFIGMMLVPRVGIKKTLVVVGSFAAATIVGYVLGHYALPHMGLVVLNILQGLIAGTLLHVVFHNVSVGGAQEFKYAKGLGALLGMVAFGFITWIVPIHEEAHASPLDVWVSMLMHVSPIWCACALLLGAAYIFSRCGGNFCRLGNFALRYLDPQPRPVAAGGSVHVFSATYFILIAALFYMPFGMTWWVAVVLGVVLTNLVFKKPDVCDTCEREGHCDIEKTFSGWLMESVGRVIVILLMASVIPFMAEPIRESIGSLDDVWRYGIESTFLIFYLGILVFVVGRRHGAHRDYPEMPTHLLMMFAILASFNGENNDFVSVCFSGLVALYSVLIYAFSESPLSIPTDKSPGGSALLKFSSCMILPVMLMGCGGWMAFEHGAQGKSWSAGIAPSAQVAIAHERAHETPHGHEQAHETYAMHTEHDLAMHPAHDDGEALVHLDDPIVIQVSGEAVSMHRMVYEEGGEEAHGAHGAGLWPWHRATPDVYEWIKFIAFVIFVMTSLYWLIRQGPRALFSRQSNHGHHHALEE